MILKMIQRIPANYYKVIMGLLLVSVVTAASATNRALLIGVGDYAINDQADSAISGHQVPDLPGIDADLANMRDIVRKMGYRDQEVSELSDDQASLEAIRQGFRQIIAEAGENDRVLIYFSGHGSRIKDLDGDETTDHKDEVLLPYDFKMAAADHPVALENVLLDDEFKMWLDKIRSRNILVIVDACHSATATRSLGLTGKNIDQTQGLIKNVFNRDNPVISLVQGGGMAELVDAANYITLAAASDEQASLATPQGSLFTLGLYEAVNDAARAGGEATPAQLLSVASQFVSDNTGELQRFTPQLDGSQVLSQTPIKLNLPEVGQGPIRQTLETLTALPQLSIPASTPTQSQASIAPPIPTQRQVARPTQAPVAVQLPASRPQPVQSGMVQISASRPGYGRGDFIQLQMQIPEDGYLNVVEVAPDDTAQVIYPNRHVADNRVSSGQFQLPPRNAAWGLTVNPPYGDTHYYVLLTRTPLNFNNNAQNRMDDNSRKSFFKVLGAGGVAQISKALTRPEAKVSSASLTLETCARLQQNRVCGH